MPYDHSLCDALTRQGCEVVFVGSPYLYTDWNPAKSYQRWDHFYRWTNWLYQGKSSGMLRTQVKGIEHVIDMERLVRRLQYWEPDIIHFQWLVFPLLDRWFLPRLRKRAKLILTVHNIHPFHQVPSSIAQSWGIGASMSSFDHLIAHTDFTREKIIKSIGIPKGRISIIPHGALDYYLKLGDGYAEDVVDGSATREQIILFFGIIKPYKGVDVLIHAFSQLPKALLEESRLWIVGYPRMGIRPLQELAERLGVANQIKWELCFIPEEEVTTVFKKASVVALPYREVDGSGVLMTALPFGKPIVATKVGGFTEVLKDGVHGHLVNSDDPFALAEALWHILSQPDLARRMGQAARQLAVEKFSWDSIAQRTVRLYKNL
jgi:glycosyltransferase involved in cell wall biosynthesis